MFERVLHEQAQTVQDFKERFPRDLIVWAGDFNQSLTGHNRGGSRARRDLLRSTLERLGLKAWNSEAPHARSPSLAVDLISGPITRSAKLVEVIPPDVDGNVISDHAGYIVEI